MNGQEQKNHKTAVATLERRTSEFADSVVARLASQEDAWRRAVADESRQRHEEEHKQRSYLDARDRELRECCQERWNETTAAQKRAFDAISAFRDRTFWGRLRWVVAGK